MKSLRQSKRTIKFSEKIIGKYIIVLVVYLPCVLDLREFVSCEFKVLDNSAILVGSTRTELLFSLLALDGMVQSVDEKENELFEKRENE